MSHPRSDRETARQYAKIVEKLQAETRSYPSDDASERFQKSANTAAATQKFIVAVRMGQRSRHSPPVRPRMVDSIPNPHVFRPGNGRLCGPAIMKRSTTTVFTTRTVRSSPGGKLMEQERTHIIKPKPEKEEARIC